MVNGPESNEWVPIGGQPLGATPAGERRLPSGNDAARTHDLVGDGPAGPEDLDKTRMQVERPADQAAWRPLQSSWLAANVPRHRSAHLLTAS